MVMVRSNLILFAALVGLADAGCTTYNRVQDSTCAETCLGSFVGICPTSLVVSKGELKAGACSALGYTTKGADLKQKAGPCGTLTFTTYTKSEAAVRLTAGAADCTNYYLVKDGTCAESCLPSSVGICPVSIVAKLGGLSQGTCAPEGYTTKSGTTSQKAGPCGTLDFTTYTKPGNSGVEAMAALAITAVADAAAHAEFLAASKTTDCPKVTPLQDLNLTEWVRASWYIQEQQVTGYQSEKDLFCVSATYDVEPSRKVPFFGGEVVSVFNYAEEDQVNGKPTNPNNKTILCARVPDKNTPSKLLVAPCFLPNLLAGDYWVLAAGPSPDNYEWAIISGGQPTVKYDDGCTTKETGTNGSGFWLFSRSEVAPADQLTMVKQKAKDLGFTLSRLHPVPQDGCKRDGAFIKK